MYTNINIQVNNNGPKTHTHTHTRAHAKDLEKANNPLGRYSPSLVKK